MSRSSHPTRKTWPAWAMLGVGLLVTGFASLQVKHRIEADAVEQMVFSYDQATLKIQERLSAYALILRGAAGLFAASDTVERQEWRAYVEKLQSEKAIPGVQGIGFAQVIPSGQLITHIAAIRQEGFPDYTVRPPGERAITTAIIYLEPFRDRNLRAFGFDMFSEPVRRAAMEQARDTGTAALSGKVELVQETGKEVQAGTLMYVPVYRNGATVDTLEQKQAALLGWVYSPYRLNDLMSGILHDWEYEEGKAINLHIYDGPQATPAALLFDNQVTLTPDAHSLFQQQRTIDFNGHAWLLVFDHTATASSINYAAAWSTLGGGLALSGLLFGLILSVINTRANAAHIAEELTEQVRRREDLLKDSELRYRTVAEFTADWEYWLLPDGTFRYISPSCEAITGYAADEFYADPELLTRIIHPDDQPLWAAHTHHRTTLGIPEPIDYRIRTKDGAYLWISHVCRPVVETGGRTLGLRGSNREISRQKKAEAELKRINADLNRFSEITAHHLMEPSRRLLVYARRLSSQIKDRLDDEDMRLSLLYIEQGATRLRNLVRGIERYLAADHPRGPLVMTDLVPIIAALKQRFSARLAASHAVVEAHDLPLAYLDSPRLTDILDVLLDNALLHRSPDIAPRIWISGERYAEGTRLRVEDNGPGIPEEYRQRVFEVFERLTPNPEAGTGIGLAIARRIVESRGGRIWIETSPQGGAAVLVDLPDSSET
jgi:PAS domain S-box-containing protein